MICAGVAQIVEGDHVKMAVSGQEPLVIITSSKLGVHVPLVIVQRSVTLQPAVRPFSVVFGVFTLPRFATVIPQLEVTTDQVPVPTVGAFAARVAVLIQTLWSGPAFAVEGCCVTVTVNVVVVILLFVALSFTVTVITAVPY